MKGYIVIGTKAYNFECDIDCPIAVHDNEYTLWCPMTNRICDLDSCPAQVPTGRWWEE